MKKVCGREKEARAHEWVCVGENRGVGRKGEMRRGLLSGRSAGGAEQQHS